MILRVELPRARRNACQPNARAGWRAKAADVAAARSAGRVLALRAMGRAELARGAFAPRCVLLVTRWWGANPDVDNCAAAMKAYQDGIFDALGANDRDVVCMVSAKIHDRNMGREFIITESWEELQYQLGMVEGVCRINDAFYEKNN